MIIPSYVTDAAELAFQKNNCSDTKKSDQFRLAVDQLFSKSGKIKIDDKKFPHALPAHSEVHSKMFTIFKKVSDEYFLTKHEIQKANDNLKKMRRIARKKTIKYEKKEQREIAFKNITDKMLAAISDNITLFHDVENGSTGPFELISFMKLMGVKKASNWVTFQKCKLSEDQNRVVLEGPITEVGELTVNQTLLTHNSTLTKIINMMKRRDLYVEFINRNREDFNKTFGNADEYIAIFEKEFNPRTRKILLDTEKAYSIVMS